MGGIDGITRHCRPDQISGSVRLRPTELGVDGVLDLRGDHCHLPVSSGIEGLLTADGTPLDVPFMKNPPMYSFPAHNHRGILAFPAGRVSLGFAWNGSWCGAEARALRARVGSHMVTVPVAGAGPPCHGTSNSYLLNGAFGFIGDRVQAGPAAWSHLTSSFHVPATIQQPTIERPSVTFHNATGTDITLLPTPAYSVSIFIGQRYRHDDLAVRRLPFATTATVPAHGELTITIPTIDLTADWSHLHGRAFSILFEIANVRPTPATIEAG